VRIPSSLAAALFADADARYDAGSLNGAARPSMLPRASPLPADTNN